jgi:branched-chain amino acid transport system permease protein
VVGAAFLEVAPDVAGTLSAGAPWALYGVLLIVCMLAMPGGIAGAARGAFARLAGSAST